MSVIYQCKEIDQGTLGSYDIEQSDFAVARSRDQYMDGHSTAQKGQSVSQLVHVFLELFPNPLREIL